MLYRSKINSSKECWFLVDCVWLNAWSEYVNTEDGDPPGPMSTKDLLDTKNNPLPDLKARIDYRGLSPTAYFILKQLHGADKSPDIPRYTIDIYKPAVPVERLVGIQMRAVVSISYYSFFLLPPTPYFYSLDTSSSLSPSNP
ncbi:hypothetical protein EON65_59015, partial [archaeon]